MKKTYPLIGLSKLTLPVESYKLYLYVSTLFHFIEKDLIHEPNYCSRR